MISNKVYIKLLEKENQELKQKNDFLQRNFNWIKEAFGDCKNTKYGNCSLEEFLEDFEKEYKQQLILNI